MTTSPISNSPVPISPGSKLVTREGLIHRLYEAAELEHTLMCTYLYAAFSLRQGEAEGLTAEEAVVVDGWRSSIMKIAVEEMGHLTAVWNITSALGGTPRFGRGNFPLDPGVLPAGVVVKLAAFEEAVLQHFVYLERPICSNEPEGEGFAPEHTFQRAAPTTRLTPMALDYDTVGAFYATLSDDLAAFVGRVGEDVAFAGDPSLQLSTADIGLAGAKTVRCAKTALAAFAAIVEQGEGAAAHSDDSHFRRFVVIRDELAAMRAKSADFRPSFPAATNPVYRPPLHREGRVHIENEEAAATVDLANTAYGLMLRLLAHAYAVPRSSPEKALAVDLALGLMRAFTFLAERAARLPAGPSNPHCNAGVSFVALRDAAPLPSGASARRFFTERLDEMVGVAKTLAEGGDARVVRASRILSGLLERATRDFAAAAEASATALSAPATTDAKAPSASPTQVSRVASDAPTSPPGAPPIPIVREGEPGIERIEAKKLTLIYEGKRCIHARFCVTWGPKVFLANVQGPWIHPDAMDVEALAEIAHVCPSGAIRYERKDGVPDEQPPPVNMLTVREGGPYAVRAELRLSGKTGSYRATLCRCGASKNKPFCDGSHHEIGFDATGEPATGHIDMLPVRNGPLVIEPLTDGPLQVRGNLEIMSGTGRCVERLDQTKLCRCGGSQRKPYCDGTHAKIGFKSE